MAKEARELEQKFIATIQETTGKSLPEWMTLIDTTGFNKPGAILKWLKDNHSFGHMYANLLAGIYLNGGKPVYDYDVLFTKLFDGKGILRPTYDTLENAVKARLSDVEFIPTKSYISIEAARVFACATLTTKCIRVGLDLGETPFGEYVQKAKGLGAMPNISHMVEVTTPDDITTQLIDHVERAYQRTHTS